jgi:hypothetical protein
MNMWYVRICSKKIRGNLRKSVDKQFPQKYSAKTKNVRPLSRSRTFFLINALSK